MRVAIMQPYFLPYIGYYQLIAAADIFVVYDNIKYTKKGWINRNRMLLNGADATFSLPLKKDSDYLDIVQREISPDFDRGKLLNQFRGAYGRAPLFSQAFPSLERAVRSEDDNLFRYIHNSIVESCGYLGVGTEIRASSEIAADHDLKGQERVIAICKALGATTYVNAIGGLDLYAPADFNAEGIELKFIKSKPFEYAQFGNAFVPWLSIVDVMMFNSKDDISGALLGNFELI